MTASLQQRDAIPLSSFPQGSAAQEFITRKGLPDLLIAGSVSSVGVSHGHQKATIGFLGAVIRLWHRAPFVLRPQGRDGDFEGLASNYGHMRALWTSRSHTGFPLWLAGTAHLIRAIEDSSIDSGELRCSILIFKEAMATFKSKDNPSLQAAVRNNFAIAALLRADALLKADEIRKKAHSQLYLASKDRNAGGQGASVAEYNRLALGLVNESVENVREGK